MIVRAEGWMDPPKQGRSEKSLTEMYISNDAGSNDVVFYILFRVRSVTVAGIHEEISRNGSFRYAQVRARRFGASMCLNCGIETFLLFTNCSLRSAPKRTTGGACADSVEFTTPRSEMQHSSSVSSVSVDEQGDRKSLRPEASCKKSQCTR